MPGTICFIMDDGYSSAYNQVAPLFESKGLRCGFAVGSKLRFSSLPASRFIELQARGHEILNHGRTHQNLSAADSNTYLARNEVIDSQEELEELGLEIRSYVAANSTLAEAHVVNHLAPSHESGFTTYSAASGTGALQVVPLDPLRMHRTPLHTVGVAGAKATVDAAVAAGGFAVFYDHDPARTEYANSMSLADLEEVLDYCIASGTEILLPSQAIAKLLPVHSAAFDRAKMQRLALRRRFANLLDNQTWTPSSSAIGTFSASGWSGSLAKSKTLTIVGGKPKGAGGFVVKNDSVNSYGLREHIGALCFSTELRSASTGINERFAVLLGIYARRRSDNAIVFSKVTSALYLDATSRRYHAPVIVGASDDLTFEMFLKAQPIHPGPSNATIVMADPVLNYGLVPCL